MTAIPRIWVVQEGNNDYSSAESFGEVRFITTGDLRSMNGKQNSDVYADIRKFASEYLLGTDYIVPVGNPMVISLVVMSLFPGNHKFLKWDGRRATYIPFILNRNMVLTNGKKHGSGSADSMGQNDQR